MPTDTLSLEQIRNAVRAAGELWEPGVTSLSSLPLAEKRKHLGVQPPPGEPSLEEVRGAYSQCGNN